MPSSDSGASQRLGWIIGLTALAFVLGGSVTKTVPGGPFISVVGDILPSVAALAAIRLGFVALRGRRAGVKFVAALCLLVASLTLGRIMIDVYTFWSRPYARGELIGI